LGDDVLLDHAARRGHYQRGDATDAPRQRIGRLE
jgi:hypothetical protein